MSLISFDTDDRVMVFIDVRNLMGSTRKDSSFSKVDFVYLARHLKGPRKLVAAYAFDSKGVLDSEEGTHRFHDYLRYKGFRVVARDGYDAENRQQKEVDVAMACQMVVHALKDNYDVAVVVSGDRDFIPAIQEVQAAGKRVEVAAVEGSFSEELRRVADVYIDLDQLPVLSMFNPIPDEGEMESEDDVTEGGE